MVTEILMFPNTYFWKEGNVRVIVLYIIIHYSDFDQEEFELKDSWLESEQSARKYE